MPSALITGGAKRLGAEIARDLTLSGGSGGAERFRVAVHYRGSRVEAEALAAEIANDGGEIALFQGDLSDPAQARTVVESASEWAGGLDLCVNNASQFVNDSLLEQPNEASVEHMAVNLVAPEIMVQHMAGQRTAQQTGRDSLVINMLDNKLFALNPDFHSYTLSKMALKSMTEMAAMQFNGRPRVCGIAPSITLISGKQNQENFEKSSRINPLERRVLPQDICAAVRYLWHAKSSNGQIITIDGGQSLMRLPRDVAFLVKDGAVDGTL
ncbi:MAG: SDR family oxidoreductase [Pseudomonadota bacterium]